jgi:hypothetical protein
MPSVRIVERKDAVVDGFVRQQSEVLANDLIGRSG